MVRSNATQVFYSNLCCIVYPFKFDTFPSSDLLYQIKYFISRYNQSINCLWQNTLSSLFALNKVLLSASLKKYVVRKKPRKLWKSSVNLESIPWSYYIISNTCFLEVRSFLRQNKKKNISSYKHLGKFKAIWKKKS